MKDILLKILIELKETESWDLAEDFLMAIYNLSELSDRYFESIYNFLEIASKITKDKVKKENMEKAILKLKTFKEIERKEKENENSEDILKELEYIY